MYDYHLHSNYSDGRFLPQMLRAASDAGLDGIGFADHCNVSVRESRQSTRALYGFNLDRTYERRRHALERLCDRADITVYDAVEMDYEPRDEAEIRAFLDEAGFDYAIGSVHTVAEYDIQLSSQFEGLSDDELDRVVDHYFDNLLALTESELFDVAAHPDLFERTPQLRGRATEDHYRRAAEAFAESRTVPEINAGRAFAEDDLVHPDDPFLEELLARDVSITVGTDSHRPNEIADRAAFLDEFTDEWGVEPVRPPSLTD